MPTNADKYREVRRMLCLFLKSEAEQKGLTHEQIAQATGFIRPNVTRMLNGQFSPSLDNFLRLADAIGVNFFMESKNSSGELNSSFEAAMSQLGRRPGNLPKN